MEPAQQLVNVVSGGCFALVFVVCVAMIAAYSIADWLIEWLERR